MGMGMGGRGWRHRFFATGLTGWQRAAAGMQAFGGCVQPQAQPAPAGSDRQEIEALKAQADQYADALEAIRRRIDELCAAKPGETEESDD